MPSAILDQLDVFGPVNCPLLSYDQAADYTRRLAKSHYENFTVVSWFLPRALRDDFRHVYAFCRWADDLGDETGDPRKSLELLEWWKREVDACYAGAPRHPVFVALHRTIARHGIPRKPFDDLIDAFVQDQRVTRYDTWEQVVDYCTRSADPVGRLVLYLCGYRDEARQRLSDATCTALQLANFWQDARRDVLERDRIYIPRDVAHQHGLDVDAMAQAIRAHERDGQPMPASLVESFRGTLRELVERTWPLFVRGHQLWPLLRPRVRADVRLFTLGGQSILRLIERQDFDTLRRRPSLGRGAKIVLMMKVLAGRIAPGWGGQRGGAS